MTKTTITRFAPSPTGALHLGHIYSAMMARARADYDGGFMRLRIDDIDHTRCRDEYTQAIYDDLDFMGIGFDGDVLVQSRRLPIYQAALARLKAQGLIYPCFLTRRELDDLLSAPHEDITIRNTDQNLSADAAASRAEAGEKPAWRLRIEAVKPLAAGLYYTEEGDAPIALDLDRIGDVVIARKDIGAGYHLSVVLDDGDSNITHVTRGNDLQSATPIHRLVYHLLEIAPPIWCHHRLITDDNGKRLAKRDLARSIKSLRDDGMTAVDIRKILPKIRP